MSCIMRVFGYCKSCGTHQDSQPQVQEERLDNFCGDCGDELEKLTTSEYTQKVHDECNWPIKLTFDVPAKMSGDYSHRIKEEIGAEVLPFDWDEYYIDRRVGTVTVTVEINESGEFTIIT